MKTVSEKRWDDAQSYEKQFWKGKYVGGGDGYAKQCQLVMDVLKKYTEIEQSTKVLQIGCGPEDVIHHWEVGITYAIDPLIDYYNDLAILKTGSVEHHSGRGEEMPYSDDFFDIVIINNVLDHVQDPGKVISEIGRCLKKNGYLYISTNVRNKLQLPLLKLLWTTRVATSKGHPYLFTKENIRSLLAAHRFGILESWSYKGTGFRMSFSFRNFKKLMQWIIGYRHVYLCVNA